MSYLSSQYFQFYQKTEIPIDNQRLIGSQIFCLNNAANDRVAMNKLINDYKVPDEIQSEIDKEMKSARGQAKTPRVI